MTGREREKIDIPTRCRLDRAAHQQRARTHIGVQEAEPLRRKPRPSRLSPQPACVTLSLPPWQQLRGSEEGHALSRLPCQLFYYRCRIVDGSVIDDEDVQVCPRILLLSEQTHHAGFDVLTLVASGNDDDDARNAARRVDWSHLRQCPSLAK